MIVICQNENCGNEFEIEEVLDEGTIVCDCPECETKMVFEITLV